MGLRLFEMAHLEGRSIQNANLAEFGTAFTLFAKSYRAIAYGCKKNCGLSASISCCGSRACPQLYRFLASA